MSRKARTTLNRLNKMIRTTTETINSLEAIETTDGGSALNQAQQLLASLEATVVEHARTYNAS